MTDTLVANRLAELLAEFPPDQVSSEEFLGAQFDFGLAWVHFPEGCGGLGIDPGYQEIVDARLREVGGPARVYESVIAMGMGAPVLMTHGTDAQRSRHLRRIFAGQEIWCQLFSEPGAGSDVAGLATMAVPDGDDWVISGQKVWTSYAHTAQFGLLAARTDPNVPKHDGLTYFIADMSAPGVDVRPLRQMTGEAEFNEVFLDGVRIPDSQRLGAVGDGWSVMLTTLMNERVTIGTQLPQLSPLTRAIELWQQSGSRDPLRRDRLTRLWIRAECARMTAHRLETDRGAADAGPIGSIGKLLGSRLNQDANEFCVDLLGPAGMLYGDYKMRRHRVVDEDCAEAREFLRSRANTIEGGTSEVMRSILAERVLGLPKDIRVDRDVAWKDVPRS